MNDLKLFNLESMPLKTMARSAPEIDYDVEIRRVRENLRRRKNKIINVSYLQAQVIFQSRPISEVLV